MNEEILKRLEEIEKRAAKATPGPWEIKHYKGRQGEAWWHSYYCRSRGRTVWGGLKRLTWDGEDPIPSDDLLFISNAREDVPWLCELALELLDRLSKLESAARLALQALTEGMADVPAERDKRCAELRVKAKRALREALGLASREENNGDL